MLKFVWFLLTVFNIHAIWRLLSIESKCRAAGIELPISNRVVAFFAKTMSALVVAWFIYRLFN